MMKSVHRWAIRLLEWLVAEAEPESGTAAAAAADPAPQPISDTPPAPEEATREAAPPTKRPSVPRTFPPNSHDSALLGEAPEGCPCRGVVLSDRAYSAIFAETLHRHPLETGGILLGQQQDGITYVVEATDPGLKTEHSRCNHQMDETYLNHVYRHKRRMYRKGLDLRGLWHRHPGDFDGFSATDMATNADYARAIGDSTLSMLVNLDSSSLRLTCYYCPLQPDGTVKPVQVPVLVGDELFEGTEFLSYLYPDSRIEPITNRRAVYAADKTA